MQKLLADSKSGKLPRCVQARIQGPFDSFVKPEVELRSFRHLLVVGGGVGVATVVPALKRIALMHEEEKGVSMQSSQSSLYLVRGHCDQRKPSLGWRNVNTSPGHLLVAPQNDFKSVPRNVPFWCCTYHCKKRWNEKGSPSDMGDMHAGDVPKIALYHTARTLDELAVIAPLLQHTNLFKFHLHLTQDVPTAVENAEMSPSCTTDNLFEGSSASMHDITKTIRMALPLPDYTPQKTLQVLGTSQALATLAEGPDAWGTLQDGVDPVGTLDTVPEGYNFPGSGQARFQSSRAVGEGIEHSESARLQSTRAVREGLEHAESAPMRPLGVRSSAPRRSPEATTAHMVQRDPRQSLDALLGPQPGHVPRAESRGGVRNPSTFEVAPRTLDSSRPTGYPLAQPESLQTYLNPLADLHDMLPPEDDTNGDSVSVWGQRNFVSEASPSRDEGAQTSDGKMVEYLTKRVEQLQLELDTLGENWKKVAGSTGELFSMLQQFLSLK